ncbi:MULTISPECIES: MFS transporter [unclassified Sphingomonas]|uniref:MFS transporter n=1 Tax=unclassified Sphingomonas TaxID=196159 RepID=UPI0006F6880E|nr:MULTISPECIES: MFS transporter [unclassified Sphingomonas]KQX23429.1 hypothetical protein ASD17_03775 [Sphingomonas sp. Root1294]KQY68280.1 hypothetical protein ASD39_06295 [Sphingomonas sp. Root50]KRB91180.1 hypothetical protein ASE22_13100 [Sphingomonas sp. Root720]
MIPQSAPAEASSGKVPWLLLLRLAIVNSIGFSGSTLVPVWVSGMGERVGAEPWFGGFVATSQLIATALFNLLTPVLFAKVRPDRLARMILPAAALIYLATQAATPELLFGACLLAGGLLGIVLNATNRIVAESVHVQKGYVIFQLTESAFSAAFIMVGTLVVATTDIVRIFLCNALICVVGVALLHRLPVKRIAPQVDQGIKATISPMAIPALFAITLFFIGQNGILSYSVPLGRLMGLEPSWVTGTISIGLAVALIGAILADVVGERWGMRLPIVGSTLVLALVFQVMTLGGDSNLFLAGLFWMSTTTMFIVPYFFTLLAKLDRSGRIASVGPAFLVAGVALGSGMGALVSARHSAMWIGPAAGISLLLSALLILLATRRMRSAADRSDR